MWPLINTLHSTLLGQHTDAESPRLRWLGGLQAGVTDYHWLTGYMNLGK